MKKAILDHIANYECIIWDWNGTLLDDSKHAVDCINSILPSYNTPLLTLEKYRECFDFPIKKYYQNIGLDLNKYSFEEIRDEYVNRYNNTANLKTSLFPETLELLNQISLTKKQYILSAVSQWNLDSMTAHFGIENLFIERFGINNHYAESKLQRGQELLKLIAVPKDKIILIGDTVHDHEVATQLGIACLLLPFGHQSIERLKAVTTNVI